MRQYNHVISTRILGRRKAPFPASRITYHVKHGFAQDPSTDPKMLVLGNASKQSHKPRIVGNVGVLANLAPYRYWNLGQFD